MKNHMISCTLVIVDDIERLLEYTQIGPRFSNSLLQTLMVLVKKLPPKEGRRLLVIGTTSEPVFVQDSGLVSAFQLAYQVPVIKTGSSLSKCLEEWRSGNSALSSQEASKVRS